MKEEEGRKKLLMNRSTSGGVTPGSWVLGKQSCCEDNCNCPRLSHVGHCGGGRRGRGGMSDAYQVLMRRFRAAAPAAATPPTGYTYFTPLTQTLSWEMGRQVLVFHQTPKTLSMKTREEVSGLMRLANLQGTFICLETWVLGGFSMNGILLFGCGF